LVVFRILGPLEVVEHGRPVSVGAPKVRALLAVLLLHRGEVVSTDRLIDALWGERASATAAKTVQVYVSNLRKALGDGVLVTRGGGYVLQTAAGQVDADRFDALAAEGRRTLESGDARAAGALLREALALWRGPALAEFAYEEFAQTEIVRLEEARLEALEDRIDADLGAGGQTGLVGELESLVAEHPLRERLHGQLMLALYRSGRQADALEHYRKARESMVQQLGLEPGPRLQELERAILAHDPALDPAPRATRPPPPAARRLRRGGWLIAAAGAILLAALVAAAVKLSGSGSGSGSVRVLAAANSVAVIDPHTDRVVASTPVGTQPGPVVFGSGSLWVASLDDQIVSRIEPRSLRTLDEITLPNPPTGLAATAGAIWVAQSNPQANSVSVNRIDPEFDAVGSARRLYTVVPGDPAVIAAQGNGVWVAPGSGLLTRLDPTTGQEGHPIDPNSSPAAIAIGDGAIWLTDSEANNVTRVDPTGLSTPIAVGDGPTGIAVSAEGVWVVDSLDDTVKRIDPAARSVVTTISVGRSPGGIAVGAGSVWVANSGAGTVSRIDPRTNKVVATITVGGSPQAITVADGRVWVTIAAQTIKSTPASGGGTLRIDSQSGLDYLDPALAYFVSSWQLLYATCARLLTYPDKPGLAASQLTAEVATGLPTRSRDGRTYMFTIRRGFRFSPPSNQAVTAQTFKDTIERTLNPRMRSPLAHYLSDVVGARAYMAARAAHVTGVVANGETLTIRLLHSVPDLPSRIALPAFCAVPSNTPIDPKGVQTPIPSAGPYYVSSYTPKQSVVLLRNPNYHGSRPRRVARIELDLGISYQRAVANIESGSADLTTLGGPGSANERGLLAARYGPDSQAAKHGTQQYFVNPWLNIDFFVLNTHRPLFSDVRLRRAVNYAVDRRALATLGAPLDAGRAVPTDHYLPPEIPGFVNRRSYPLAADPAHARALAQGDGRTAVLYTCELPLCAEQAQVLKTDLAAIGLRLEIKQFSVATMYTRENRPGEPFDIGFAIWIPDYPDPGDVLGPLLTTGSSVPSFADPAYQRQLAQAAQLTGPKRYRSYGVLDLDLVRNAAPLIAYADSSAPDFFSARIGCQTYGVYGVDLAALCIKHS
jgi:YVTN family beta-propeller protein